jgi:hypothetical protein
MRRSTVDANAATASRPARAGTELSNRTNPPQLPNSSIRSILAQTGPTGHVATNSERLGFGDTLAGILAGLGQSVDRRALDTCVKAIARAEATHDELYAAYKFQSRQFEDLRERIHIQNYRMKVLEAKNEALAMSLAKCESKLQMEQEHVRRLTMEKTDLEKSLAQLKAGSRQAGDAWSMAQVQSTVGELKL